MTRVTLFVCALLALGATAADAGVTRIEIERREVFAGGYAFGAVGAYEKVVGRFHGELDPAHALNAGTLQGNGYLLAEDVARIVEQAAATIW